VKLAGRVLILCFCAFLAGRAARAAEVVWDPNPENEMVTGYIVCFGPVSHADVQAFVSYPHQVDVGSALSFDLSGIASEPDARYLAVVAYNRYGSRSDYSNPLSLEADGTSGTTDGGTSGSSGGGGGGGGGCFLSALRGD
jgi:uncharacterized membrane protein YgcG